MDKIAQFLEITSTDNADVAKYYLEVTNGNLDAAVSMVFEDGGGNTSGGTVVSEAASNQADCDLTILEWNVQGLLGDFLKERTVAVVNLIKQLKPSVVMLQEVILQTYSYFESSLKDKYFVYSPTELRYGPSPAYFTAMLVSRASFKSVQAKLHIFAGSQQGRDLLMVSGKFNGRNITLMTSHLESTKPAVEERKNQLAEIYQKMTQVPADHTVVFGADTNLRDDEVKAVIRACKFNISKVNDVWNMLGSPPEARYSWDLQTNDNQIKNGKARLRFERLYTRVESSQEHYKPKDMTFVGMERLPCGLFASDHWGILATFTASA